MKKLLAAILMLFVGAFCVTADDVSDIKQAFARLNQYYKAANLDGALSMYSKDYMNADTNGQVITYTKCRALIQMLKATDVKEFLTLFIMVEENRKPTQEELQQLANISPEQSAQFAQLQQQMINGMKKEGALIEQTIKFVDIKVYEGKTARVVVEYTALDSKDETRQKTKQTKEISILRKENGSWKFLMDTEIY